MAGGPQFVRTARRLVPVAIALYHRWDELPPERKEHYRRLARQNAERTRQVALQGAERSRRFASDAWRRRQGR